MNLPCALGEKPESKPLLIVKLGEAHDQMRERLGDFEDWIAAGLREGGAANIKVVDPRAGAALPDPTEVAGIVITGSHSMVSHRDPWSVALMPWLVRAVEVETPTLGICFGHQLLAQSLGGEVDDHPEGVEIGSITLQRHAAGEDDELVGDLPASFEAQSVHWQSVRRLPPNAVLLASTAFEPNHAYRVGNSAWGVQFHPEFSEDVLRAYLERIGPALSEEGKDVEAIFAALEPTPLAASLLPRFARLTLARALTNVVMPG